MATVTQKREWIARVLNVSLPEAGGSAQPPADMVKMLETLGNMKLAIVKIAGPAEAGMSETAERISQLIASGDIAAAKKLMDELSRQLAAAIKAKQANDLRKQLERQQARIKGCGANAVIIRSLEALASDADSKIKDQDIAGAKAAIRKLTDQLDKISPEIDPRQQDAEAGEAYTDANGKPASALAIWRDAKETVDTGISALQDRMRAHPLKALGRIADAGLAGITSREAVGMMVAVTEAERSTTAAAPAVAKATAALRAFLATDAAAAIDENPFGVQVNLRATMQSAMSAIERSVGI